MSETTLESALGAFLEYKLRGFMTAIPARVENIRSAEEGRVDVKPLINSVFPDYDDSQEFPTLLSVPLVYPSSSTSAVTFPVNVGDTVLLVFSQKSLDVFKGGNTSPSAPSDYRTFSLRDAIAIPGLFPFQNSVNKASNRTLPHDTQDMVVSHNLGTEAEAEIRIKPTGEIQLTSPLKVVAVAPEIDLEATTSINVLSPIANVVATTSATITAPVANILSATTATITSPLITLTGATGVAVTSASFTWNGQTVMVV